MGPWWKPRLLWGIIRFFPNTAYFIIDYLCLFKIGRLCCSLLFLILFSSTDFLWVQELFNIESNSEPYPDVSVVQLRDFANNTLITKHAKFFHQKTQKISKSCSCLLYFYIVRRQFFKPLNSQQCLSEEKQKQLMSQAALRTRAGCENHLQSSAPSDSTYREKEQRTTSLAPAYQVT